MCTQIRRVNSSYPSFPKPATPRQTQLSAASGPARTYTTGFAARRESHLLMIRKLIQMLEEW
jgi:hypothetical protein